MLLTEFIGEKYEAIDRTEKKAFWIVFLFGFILYSFYIFNFLIGDHSILSILKPMEEALASGRFSGLLINRLTLSLYLPVLSPLINIF